MSAYAVSAGVTTTNNDNVLALSQFAELFRLSFFDVPKLFVFGARNSIANRMLLRSRPSIGRSRGLVAPQQRHGIKVFHQLLGGNVFANFDTASNGNTLGFHQLVRRVTTSFSSFMLGIPYIRSPPGRSARSSKRSRGARPCLAGRLLRDPQVLIRRWRPFYPCVPWEG